MNSDFRDIPQGLSMALIANSAAMEQYSSLTDDQRAMLVARASGVSSKREMNQMVQELTMGKFPM